ncbi:MAG: FtsX-like permease family protein, partial [Bacteroidota bacterium]
YTLADAFDVEVVGILVLLLLVTGLVAGSYPALLLSGFRPIETLGRRLKLGGTNVLTRSLVVIQFALSVFLIISTLVMQQQMQHTRTMDLGFNRDHMLQINTEGMDGRRMVKRLQQQLANEPRIAGVTAAGVSMGWSGSIGTRYTHGDHQYTLNIFTVEANYFDVFDIAFAQGRPFDPSTSADSSYVIVNQAALDDYRQKNGGLEEPLGTVLPGMDGMGVGQLIGVVEDFNYNVLYQDHAPAIFMLHSFFGVNYIYIRLLPGDVAGGLAAAESAWQAAIPDVPFRYRFLDEDMQQYYEDDQRWSNIVRYASLVAIFLACLGLLGLAALTAARRTKEVGIRKVLGASVPSLVGLVTREFLVMVVLGIIIAVPAGYIVMQQWLNDFVFRIELGPTLFVLGGVLALLLAGSVVSYQGFRAARTNPVDSLRYE